MGNLLAYSGIVTKIHGMRAKLLKPEQFEAIAALGSVPEIVDYLKGTQHMRMYWNPWRMIRYTAAISRRFLFSHSITIIRRSTASAVRNRDSS